MLASATPLLATVLELVGLVVGFLLISLWRRQWMGRISMLYLLLKYLQVLFVQRVAFVIDVNINYTQKKYVSFCDIFTK